MAKAAAQTRPAIELDEGKTADLAEMFRLLGDGSVEGTKADSTESDKQKAEEEQRFYIH